MSELKPCPFCGGEADYSWITKPLTITIKCIKCPVARTSKFLRLSFEEALKLSIEAWNARAETENKTDEYTSLCRGCKYYKFCHFGR